MKNRIYGECTDINTEHVREFYNKRAALWEQKGWGVVALGDEDPTVAERTYCYDRDILFPKLGIDRKDRVLELGCGMGRVASIVLPRCGSYCGVDFSQELLKIADKICEQAREGKPVRLCHASIVDAVEPGFLKEKYTVILISAVCMYVNDKDLQKVFRHIPDLCEEHCTVMVSETAAYEQRLTLDNFRSEALQSSYDAIYRTREEYNGLFRPLVEAGFTLKEQDWKPDEMGQRRSETNALFSIFTR